MHGLINWIVNLPIKELLISACREKTCDVHVA